MTSQVVDLVRLSTSALVDCAETDHLGIHSSIRNVQRGFVVFAPTARLASRSRGAAAGARRPMPATRNRNGNEQRRERMGEARVTPVDDRARRPGD